MLKQIALVLGLALPTATIATAQAYDWRTVLSETVKVQMVINSEFEFSKERFVPLHFTMGVPFAEGALITRTWFPEQEGNLGEFLFMTPDEQLLEYVTISVGTIGGETADERLQRVFAIIEQQVYPSFSPPPDAEILGGRITEIGGNPAVEFVSLFDDPAQGPVAARIVGVISPNNTDVLFFAQQSLRDRLNLGGPDELSGTFAGSMLSGLTFQAYRNAAGDLVAF